MPPSSAPRTPIQPRPLVSRMIRLESEKSGRRPHRGRPPAGRARRPPWRVAAARRRAPAGTGATAACGAAPFAGAAEARAVAAAAISRPRSCLADLEGGAQVRRARARVPLELLGARGDARLVISSASGSRPQTQTGSSGGQTQPRARSARKRLTRRSSSEWKEIAPRRPPTGRIAPGQRQRPVERVELAVDGDADRLEGALGRMPAAEALGGRDRGLDRGDELGRWSRSGGA